MIGWSFIIIISLNIFFNLIFMVLRLINFFKLLAIRIYNRCKGLPPPPPPPTLAERRVFDRYQPQFIRKKGVLVPFDVKPTRINTDQDPTAEDGWKHKAAPDIQTDDQKLRAINVDEMLKERPRGFVQPKFSAITGLGGAILGDPLQTLKPKSWREENTGFDTHNNSL